MVALAGAPVAAAGSGATPTPIPTTSPSPSPSATPGDDDVDEVPPDPLEVTIERLTPSSLPTRGERGEVRVRGTVTNRSADEWRDLSVYLVTSQEPITSKAELAAAAATDPRAEVATRIVEPGLFVEVRDLRPGERTGFRLAVPTDQLGISGEPGVYWLGVQVLASSDLGRDASADGRARTFLPLVPERNDGTELALAMQIRNHTVRSFDGRLEYLEGWQATLAEGGRLRRLLDLSATATSDQELSWVVDPALVDSALSVARGNPALEMAPPAEGGAGGDGSSGEDGDEPTPEQAAADQWLSDFFAAARVRSVMTLPYGDLDVSAVLRHGVSDLLTTAFGSSTQLLAENGVSASPVLLPPSGLLSPSAVAELDPGLPLVLAPEALVGTSPEPLLNRADGGRILVAPIPDDMWGPEPGSRSALAVRQRLLADAALHALSPARDEPVVRFLPPGWDPGDHWRRARFFRGLDVPWLSPVDVRDVLDGLSTAPAVDPAENVGYPDAELEAELPLPTVLSTEALIAEGSTVEELVTDDSDVDEQVIRQALLDLLVLEPGATRAGGRACRRRARPGGRLARRGDRPRTGLRHHVQRERDLPGHRRERPRPTGHRGAPRVRDGRRPAALHPRPRGARAAQPRGDADRRVLHRHRRAPGHPATGLDRGHPVGSADDSQHPQQPGRVHPLDRHGRRRHGTVRRDRAAHLATGTAPPQDARAGAQAGRLMSEDVEANRSILSSSAVMAAGTTVSRLSGFVRSTLLAAALGTQLHADVFTIANTVPNMLYILLAGGVFNAVLVPQLVRAMRSDPDGGDAYTNRIVTLAGLFLAGTTALLVLGAPLLMRLYLDDAFFTDALAAQRDSVIDFARLCLPQVFFYGMFVLVGQVLNARGRFGPMMWAPIANNVISVAVLVLYLFVYGAAQGDGLCGGYTTGQEWLLGLGSTIGIAVQFLILLPYLKAAGFSYRPRFDFRGTGLGHTFRLGFWTVAFVVVNQIAYTVVVRLASSGTAEAATACGAGGGAAGTGYTIYSGAFLLVMVPHSIATVSLATATLPRLSSHAADGDLGGVGRQVAATTRTALSLILPFALLLPVIALPLSDIVWGYAAAAETSQDFAVSLALFAPGLRLLHRALPDAPGVLLAGAHPHGVLGAVRDRGGRTSCWPCSSPAASRRRTPRRDW